MDQFNKQEFVALAAQWKLLAEALVRKGLGGKKHTGKTLSAWCDLLATPELTFISAEFAIAVVNGLVAEWIREELEIRELCFSIQFDVVVPMAVEALEASCGGDLAAAA